MRKISLLLAVLILVFVTSTVSAQDVSINNQTLAENLHALNILKGSDKGFELDKSLTRIEGSVMMVRLLGKEDEALKLKLGHPFTDVPNWASNYVGYLYQNNITNGINNSEFGTEALMSAAQYTTFVLRALGYDDKQGEFSWYTALEKAVEVNIISEIEKTSIESKASFLRDDMVFVSHNALKGKLKESDQTLVEKLIDESAVDKEVAEQLSYVIKEELPIDENISSILEEVVQGYYTAIYNHDLKALQYFPETTEESLSVFFEHEEKNKTRSVYTYDNFQVLSVTSNTAKVSLIETIKLLSVEINVFFLELSDPAIFTFKKVNGNWIIDNREYKK